MTDQTPHTMSEKLKRFLDLIADSIRDAPQGMPEGHLYAILLTFTPNLTADQFSGLLELVKALHPDIKSQSHLIYAESRTVAGERN